MDTDLWAADFIMNGSEFCSKYLIIKNAIPNASAVLIRRSFLEQSGGIDSSMKLCGDWLCWVKILKLSDVAFITQNLNYFRVHSETARVKSAENFVDVIERYKIVDFVINNFDVSIDNREKSLNNLLRLWIKRVLKSNLTVTEKINKIYGLILSIRNYDRKVFHRLPRLLYHGLFRIY